MAWNSLAEPSGWYSLCQILTLNVLAWSRGQNYGLGLDLEAKILVSSGLEDKILVLVWVSVWVSGLIWVSVQVWVSGGWSGSQSGSQEFGLDLLCSVLFNITESGVFVCAFSHWAVVDFSLCKSTHSLTHAQCVVKHCNALWQCRWRFRRTSLLWMDQWMQHMQSSLGSRLTQASAESVASSEDIRFVMTLE